MYALLTDIRHRFHRPRNITDNHFFTYPRSLCPILNPHTPIPLPLPRSILKQSTHPLIIVIIVVVVIIRPFIHCCCCSTHRETVYISWRASALWRVGRSIFGIMLRRRLYEINVIFFLFLDIPLPLHPSKGLL
ncbi:hypothetical protein K435DRAFT_246694 [Dendrothele bispora CBS 962.96]|uniref:Uncharacterized protein n=1 Tax=Dendrothele bispora (strain CBS 962.96) TaxID=1314807 RepID=A0A4S8LNH9_DENBC|nr:hypothetical protein K435DRAFT_246694 [Dendrothele bispora CBS 962.96]